MTFYWVFFAGTVKRLRDLGYSWKWLPLVIGLGAASIAITAFFPNSTNTISVADVASILFLVPAAGIGGYGVFCMFLIPGGITRGKFLTKNDLRRILP